LATSAHYFASRLKPEATAGPFVDPRLGQFRAELASVSVAAESALVADALTKVVMLDPDNSLPLLQRFGAESLIHTLEGSMFSTPNWHERLQTAA
jgi:thiamine biosynthesis lipoprotein ApbE